MHGHSGAAEANPCIRCFAGCFSGTGPRTSKACQSRSACPSQNDVQDLERKLMWHLPGRSLKGIPSLDKELRETSDGVGPYVIVQRLSTGGFGSVSRAVHRDHGEVAIKTIDKDGVAATSNLQALDREFSLMLTLKPHVNIVCAREVLHGSKHLYLVMDFGGKEDLEKHTHSVLRRSCGSSLPLHSVENFSAQAATAVDHLHGLRVCHRDLKPSNFIVSDDVATLKLTDFGVAAVVDANNPLLQGTCGSLPFCAPEVLRAGKAGYDGFAADVWSLAVLFLELDQGPESVERMLGWHSGAPPGRVSQADALDQLPQLASRAEIRSLVVRRALHAALILEPRRRPVPSFLAPQCQEEA